MSEFSLIYEAPSLPASTEWRGDDLYGRWVAYLDRCEATRDAYTRQVRYFLTWLQTNDIHAPQRSDVIQYRDELAARMEAGSVNTYMAALRVFFHWTAQEGLYPDLCQDVRSLSVSAGFKRDYLRPEESQSVLRGIDRSSHAGIRDYALISLMVSTGLREIEISRACVGDLKRQYGCTVLWVQGKGRAAKDECVKVPLKALERLQAYLGTRGQLTPEAPLFTSLAKNATGASLTTRSIRQIIKDRFRAVGLDSERLTGHSLRHTAGTTMRRSGLSLEEVQLVLRHQSAAVTALYDHTLAREENDGEEVAAAALLD